MQSVLGLLLKYSDDQPRDERGRFGAGGGRAQATREALRQIVDRAPTRVHLQELKDRWAAVGREEGWSSPEARAVEREMLAAQHRYGVVKALLQVVGL